MNFNLQEQIPSDFKDSSKVWVYQCSRLFFLSEALQIEEMLEEFIKGWKSHGNDVKGYANLFFGQFIVLMADETTTGVSGCSMDSSVHLIKEIEKKFNVQLFDRQMLAFIIKDKIQLLPVSQLNYAAENGFINGDTAYFDNTVLTKRELLQKWIIPIKDSWLAARIHFPSVTR